MRNREFRGLRLDGKGFAYGYFAKFDQVEGSRILDTKDIWNCVDPETVDQFLGRFDKNNQKVFEGDLFYQDILLSHPTNRFSGHFHIKCLCVIRYIGTTFKAEVVKPINNTALHPKYHISYFYESFYDIGNISDIEIVGNAHQNKELFEDLTCIKT